jgi:transcriptional regulator with XRE-family HTH domain
VARRGAKGRQVPRPIEDLHEGRPASDRVLALYGPQAREIGNKLRVLRESRGWSTAVAARHMGMKRGAYERVESGAIIASREVQRRAIRVFFKQESWASVSSKPALPEYRGRARNRREMRIWWYDDALYKALEKFALAGNYSMSAVIVGAVERLLRDEPALVTVKAAIEQAERFRSQSILEANPDLVLLLEGDPIVAKLAGQVEQVEAQYESSLNNFSTRWDGAADPAVTARWVGVDDESE